MFNCNQLNKLRYITIGRLEAYLTALSIIICSFAEISYVMDCLYFDYVCAFGGYWGHFWLMYVWNIFIWSKMRQLSCIWYKICNGKVMRMFMGLIYCLILTVILFMNYLFYFDLLLILIIFWLLRLPLFIAGFLFLC